jgi:hypothetical protein
MSSQLSDILTYAEAQNLPEGTYLKVAKALKQVYESPDVKPVPKDEPLNIVCPISLDISDGPKIKIVKTYKNFYEYNGTIHTRLRHDAEISIGDKTKVVKFSRIKGDNELEVILGIVVWRKFEFTIRYDCLEKSFDFAEWQELDEDENFFEGDYIAWMLSNFRQAVNKWAENASDVILLSSDQW